MTVEQCFSQSTQQTASQYLTTTYYNPRILPTLETTEYFQVLLCHVQVSLDYYNIGSLHLIPCQHFCLTRLWMTLSQRIYSQSIPCFACTGRLAGHPQWVRNSPRR